ncbi:MAG: FecR domain-containing protein [Povalibacter sp.]
MSERSDMHKLDDDNEESLGQLLREAGARDLPSAEMMQDVRRAVHAEWQAVVAQRRRRNWYVGSGIAASIAAAAVATTIGLKLVSSPGLPVASVARIDGALQVTTDGGDEWHAVKVGETLTEGAMLRTDESTRVALDFGNGVSVRVNSGTLLELKAPHRVELENGALYLDAVPQSSLQARNAQELSVETLYGNVRHLGTQYELRTVRSGIELSVREGQVEIVKADRRFEAGAGEQLALAGDGNVNRTKISAQDARWQWATDIAPVFDIERQPLSRFLEWVARETGKKITYASPDIQARAEQMILRGSVSNLPPDQALAAVLATTPFKHRDSGSEIEIQL